MKITIEMIKELRQKTQAGITNCKKALEETNGDIESAINFLKEKGLFYHKKNKTKDILEGLTNVVVKNNKAILYELNAETDFVVQNKNFMELYNQLENILLEADSSIQNLKDFLKYQWNGQSVEELISQKSFIIKEQIVLSRIQIIYKKDEEGFGFYKHQGGKISALVHLTKSSADVEEHIPVHIVGMKPKFLSKELIDINFLNKEKEILLEQLKEKNSHKPLKDELLNKIVENKFNTLIEQNCLLEQPFYMESNQKVKEYLIQNKTDIINYYYFEVGKK
ncbi:translation elongation factor Ts [Columbia Basin potato purple top phytoplasma]|uniref:Elongation factor Ts n=1 Tax=Columbia Basin potato purple top phytoplasma TaxID=307134 RepID=A0ABT5L9D6_9MOLU|nr:translation elongation factor Ts [Columbia Basin potato purple top phytoplasma]MDC9032127.1 translation elongation factor Ts [Columbia Basin potato purple top phytoplasma]